MTRDEFISHELRIEIKDNFKFDLSVTERYEADYEMSNGFKFDLFVSEKKQRTLASDRRFQVRFISKQKIHSSYYH